MSGKKGMKKYPLEIRETVVNRIRAGESQKGSSREYGISRYAIQSWLKEPVVPKRRERKSARTIAEYKYENKRLKYDNAMAENFFSILKTECIYRHKPASFKEANEMIDRYIHFYNHERIQLKTGVAPLALRHSA